MDDAKSRNRESEGMSPTSFTASHIKRLVDSRKSCLGGIDSPNISDTYSHEHLFEDIRSLKESTPSDDSDLHKRNAVASKVAISLYGEALETCLKQATDLDDESYWWRDVESSRQSTAMYFLQSELFFRFFLI